MRYLSAALLVLPVLAPAGVRGEPPAPEQAAVLRWQPLPPLPDPVGFAGSFAGVSKDALIFGGGANFPDRPPWQGGKKAWHDSVFVLDNARGPWKTGFQLPRPNAYGVSATTREGLVCAGGSDAERHFTEVIRLEWAGGDL